MNRTSALSRVFGLTRSLSPFERGAIPTNLDDDGENFLADAVDDTSHLADGADVPGSDDSADLPPAIAAEILPAAHADGIRDQVTAQAINAIEADIASLLADMAVVDAHSNDDEGDDEPETADTTFTLLSELDRLWRADPLVHVPTFN